MIDLHNLNHESGEVGYWLSNDFQHLGIMTESVEFLKKYAFEQLKLDYLILRSSFVYLKDDENGHKVFVLRND